MTIRLNIKCLAIVSCFLSLKEIHNFIILASQGKTQATSFECQLAILEIGQDSAIHYAERKQICSTLPSFARYTK